MLRKLVEFMGRFSFKHNAFTLMELLVTLAVIAILAALLLSGLSAAKQKGQGISCMNNGRQLGLALHMYGDDYNGWLPPNPDWATNNMWVRGEMENPNDAVNTSFLTDSKLAPFIGGSVINIFKCPGDSSRHVRSYSMSQAVGTKPTPPLAAVDGPWLDGTRTHKANHPWRTYGNYFDMVDPEPSGLWVFIDENQNNINDAAFAVSMTQPTEMIDWPATYHNFSGTLAFADGHSEIHRWKDGRTKTGHVTNGPHVQTPNNPGHSVAATEDFGPRGRPVGFARLPPMSKNHQPRRRTLALCKRLGDLSALGWLARAAWWWTWVFFSCWPIRKCWVWDCP